MKFSEILKQWPALDALLDEVLDLPLAERAQWLDRQTAVKPEQRAALDELLRLGEQAPSAQLDLGQPEQGLANARLAITSLPPDANTRTFQELHQNAWEQLGNTLNFLQLPGAVDASRHAMLMRQELDGNAQSESLLVSRASSRSPPVSLGDSWGSPVPSPCARDPGSRWYWPGWAGSMSLNGNSGQSIRPIFQQTRLP